MSPHDTYEGLFAVKLSLVLEVCSKFVTARLSQNQKSKQEKTWKQQQQQQQQQQPQRQPQQQLDACASLSSREKRLHPSGQIILCHQPRFPWNSRGFFFPNATFWGWPRLRKTRKTMTPVQLSPLQKRAVVSRMNNKTKIMKTCLSIHKTTT